MKYSCEVKNMRILHTSDWHLGKTLEGFSRLEEQEKFTEEIVHIVREKQIDLVLMAGDVYDTSNPPAAAETLFYKTLQEITEDNKTGVIVISGNHDNPDRLTASSPIAAERGIILLGTPKSCVEKGKYGCMEVVDSGAGFMEIELNGERSVIITIPYPSEKRLNEIFTEELKEGEKQKSYSERIGQLFNELSLKYREDTINIAVSHVYISGGEVSDSDWRQLCY
jgi:exonuclease SbcD